MKRTCNICGTMMTGGPDGFRAHGEEHHPDHFLSAKFEFKKKKHYLPETGEWFAHTKWLSRGLKAAGLTNEYYFVNHGSKYLCEAWEEASNDPVLGDARAKPECLECGRKTNFNDTKWQYPAFCSFGCSTTWYSANTDRVAKAQETISKREAEDPDFNLRPNQLRYWIVRGHSEEEARELVAERQRTNTLERFIERYGAEEGAIRHRERQEKWFESMKDSGVFSGYSRTATSLFEKVSEDIEGLQYADSEVSIRCGSRIVSVDCCKADTKRIVEFYGDYWHANPDIFGPDDVIQQIRMTAREIWERDAIRLQLLEEYGYTIMIVWESEYKADPEGVRNIIVGFFKSEDKYLNHVAKYRRKVDPRVAVAP